MFVLDIVIELMIRVRNYIECLMHSFIARMFSFARESCFIFYFFSLTELLVSDLLNDVSSELIQICDEYIDNLTQAELLPLDPEEHVPLAVN